MGSLVGEAEGSEQSLRHESTKYTNSHYIYEMFQASKPTTTNQQLPTIKLPTIKLPTHSPVLGRAVGNALGLVLGNAVGLELGSKVGAI